MDEPTRPPDARADAKLIPMLESDPELADAMWRFRNPEKGGKKLTFAAILVWLQNEWGVSISLSTLHSSYRWLAVQRRWAAAEELAAQARAEMAKNPDLSDEDLDRFSDRVLKAEVAVKGDVKSYVSLGRLGLARKASSQRDKELDQRERTIAQREALVAQSERRVALLEAKAEFADEVKKAAQNSEGGITAEQMVEIERKLKLL